MACQPQETTPSTSQITLKFVIIGDQSVGKSNLILRFTRDTYDHNKESTVGVEFSTKLLHYRDGCSVRAQIWDTAGQERFYSMTNGFFRGAVGGFIVYDVTKRSTFENVEKWCRLFREHAHPKALLSLVANKSDLEGTIRQVSVTEGLNFAREHEMDFIETSAKNAVNVEIAFRRLIISVALGIQNHLLQKSEKESFPINNIETSQSLKSTNNDDLINSCKCPKSSKEKGENDDKKTDGAVCNFCMLASLPPLPDGWVHIFNSEQTFYENIWTGERIIERPTKAAEIHSIHSIQAKMETEKIIPIPNNNTINKNTPKRANRRNNQHNEVDVSWGCDPRSCTIL